MALHLKKHFMMCWNYVQSFIFLSQSAHYLWFFQLICYTIKSYHEDITIVKRISLKSEVHRIYGNIKTRVDIDYLVEMLLYSQYYLQANMAVDCIVSALTDLNTWHIFVLVYALELKHYYTCSEMDITPNGIFAFLSQIKHAFNFIICHKTWRARYGYRYEWYIPCHCDLSIALVSVHYT